MITTKFTKDTKDGDGRAWHSRLFLVFLVPFVVRKPFHFLYNAQQFKKHLGHVPGFCQTDHPVCRETRAKPMSPAMLFKSGGP